MLFSVPLRPEIEDGRSVAQLYKRGQQVQLFGLKFPCICLVLSSVMMAGAKTRLSSPPKQGSTMTCRSSPLGIEEFFKTAKHRFGLHRFGQQTLLGVHRWLVLSLTAYLLAHWAHLHAGGKPDWGEAAHSALELRSTDGIITIVGRKSTLTTLQTPWLINGLQM